MSRDLIVGETVLPCWICPQCGSRIFPASKREDHLRWHESVSARLRELLKHDPQVKEYRKRLR